MPFHFESKIRAIPDFPSKGILFRDFGPVFADRQSLHELKDLFIAELKKRNIKPTKILGMEARGFVLGALLAEALDCGFVMLRKPNKLPGKVHTITFDLEYRQGESLVMQEGILSPDDVVLIHDDLLATGGTAHAALELAKSAGVPEKNISMCFISELSGLGG